MSGPEILGIATSVLQIADLGARLSVNLFAFTRKVKNADKNIESISQDIAGTGAVLQLLGNELEKDETIRLCSSQAISHTKTLMADCHKIFKEINDAIDGNCKAGGAGSKLIMGLRQRLKYPFLEPQIELLRANLERLKADLMVMLNVLIYGGQLRSNEALPVLKDQQELLKQLIEDRLASQKNLDTVMKRLDQLAVSSDSSSSTAISRQTTMTGDSGDTLVDSTIYMQVMPAQSSNLDHHTPSLPVSLHARAEEVLDHCKLIEAVIGEINSIQYKLNAGIRYRAQEKILQSHHEEWSAEWQHHEREATHKYAYFEKYPLLKQYWKVNDPDPTQNEARPSEKWPGHAPQPEMPSTDAQQRVNTEQFQGWGQMNTNCAGPIWPTIPPHPQAELCDVSQTPKPAGRVHKVKIGTQAHACKFPGCEKVFSRAEVRRRHELKHMPTGMFSCTRPGCQKAFHREDLLQRHLERHDLEREANGSKATGKPVNAVAHSDPSLSNPTQPSEHAPRASSGGLSIGSLVHPQSHSYNMATPVFSDEKRAFMSSFAGLGASDDSVFSTDTSASRSAEAYGRYPHRQNISSSSSAVVDPRATQLCSGSDEQHLAFMPHNILLFNMWDDWGREVTVDGGTNKFENGGGEENAEPTVSLANDPVGALLLEYTILSEDQLQQSLQAIAA